MKKLSKLTSALLAVIMVFSVLTVAPFTVSAAEVGETEAVSATSGDFDYEILDDGTVKITDYTGSATELTIPSEINGYTVTTIGGYAFEDCTSLTSITIPDSVTSIGYMAFCDCTSLTSITIPDSVTSIGDYAFYNCTSLTSITIPDSVTSIGYGAFYNCTSLTSITIPDSVTSIGGGAFEDCTSLTSITIPDSVTSIGYGAFYNCTSLTSITIPDSVTSIGDYAFYNTDWYNNQPDGLVYAGKIAYEYKGEMQENTSIVLKDGTKVIADYAFEDCTSLTSITIPDSVTSIGYGAFCDCTSLTSITIPDSVTSIGDYALGYCSDYYSGFYTTAIKDFVIYGYAGTAAETYANENGFTFVNLGATTNPTSVKVNRSTLTLGVGESYGIIKTISPSNATQTCTWSSSNSSVASVNSSGKVTAKKAGTANITVKTSNGLTATCKVTVKPAPTSVKTNPTSVTLGVGETYTISESTNSGTYANASNLKWSSTNTSVATVTKGSANKATITAKGVGTAYVKITLYNGKTAQCKVTVKSAPTSVKTNPTSITLGKGETYTISESTNSGSYANAANLKWSSTNTSVATVTKGSGNKAVITAKGVGTAYVKITLYNGKTATCKVTVKSAPTSVSLNKTSITLNKGQTYTISESTNSGTYANSANLKWSSTNTSVATVTKGSANKATITAKSKGTAYIKITLYNGKTAQCKVTVK